MKTLIFLGFFISNYAMAGNDSYHCVVNMQTRTKNQVIEFDYAVATCNSEWGFSCGSNVQPLKTSFWNGYFLALVDTPKSVVLPNGEKHRLIIEIAEQGSAQKKDPGTVRAITMLSPKTSYFDLAFGIDSARGQEGNATCTLN